MSLRMSQTNNGLYQILKCDFMTNKLYVGGLSYSCSQEELAEAFAPHGKVINAIVISDRDSGLSKGFGFIEMGSPEEASLAIKEMNGQNLNGRMIIVNAANAPRLHKPRMASVW